MLFAEIMERKEQQEQLHFGSCQTVAALENALSGFITTMTCRASPDDTDEVAIFHLLLSRFISCRLQASV